MQDAAIHLPGVVREQIVEHARREAPNECCGLLVGTGTRIDSSVRARNVHPKPATRYLLDPAEHVATIRRLRGTGREVIGCYHSHPASPAIPSARDVADAYYPDFVWIIVSLLDAEHPDIAAYLLADGRFSHLPIAAMTHDAHQR